MTTRLQFSVFIFLWAVSIGFCWRPVAETLNLAWTNDAYTHILLIFPLSAALICMDSRTLRIEPRPSPRLGAALLALALVIGCLAGWGMTSGPDLLRLSLSILGLVTWWFGAVVFCFGIKTFQAFLFPLCFLLLIVPIPEFVLTRMVEFLQYQSAIAARILFRAIGVPVTQDGIILSIPGLDLEVASECSSIRSSLILLITTMLMAHLFLRSWWRKFLLIAMAIPLSVAKNGFRIFTIAELGTRVDRGFLTGKLHRQGGILFWGVSVIAMGALLLALRKTESPIAKRPNVPLASRS